jgi:hypothetical protein
MWQDDKLLACAPFPEKLFVDHALLEFETLREFDPRLATEQKMPTELPLSVIVRTKTDAEKSTGV